MSEHKKNKTKDESANISLAAGGTLGAVAAGEFLLLGAACPLCVVGAPALLGYGVYKKIKNSKKNRDNTKKN